jgi:hypothetical protein
MREQMRSRRGPTWFWNSVIGKCVAALLITGLSIALPVILLISLPVILPFVFIKLSIDRRRMLKTAESFHCTSCGAVLGKESLQLADEEWAKHMQQLRQDHPGVKFRIIRTFHAPQVEKDGRRYARSGAEEN